MPTYTYRCSSCGGIFTRFNRIRDHVNVAISECCEKVSSQIILTPPHGYVKPDIHFKSPTTGKLITSEDQWRNDMAESGCVEYDPGMVQDADRRLKETERELDTLIDNTVEESISRMDGDTLNRLGREIESSELSINRV